MSNHFTSLMRILPRFSDVFAPSPFGLAADKQRHTADFSQHANPLGAWHSHSENEGNAQTLLDKYPHSWRDAKFDECVRSRSLTSPVQSIAWLLCYGLTIKGKELGLPEGMVVSTSIDLTLNDKKHRQQKLCPLTFVPRARSEYILLFLPFHSYQI